VPRVNGTARPGNALPDASRRRFLQQGGLAAGGLVLGLALPVRSRPAFAAGAGPGAAAGAPAAINAYVKVAADGIVTLVVPKSEMGQGVYTGYAQVLAEELEVEWERVRVESAPVAAVYNVPFAPIQFTGGSMSISTGFDSLRKAGATARAMLTSAAAARLGVPESELRAERGTLVHAASGRSLGYGEVAAAAARLEPPADVALKPASEWRLIGRSLPRVDSRAKCDGTAIFGLDVRVPGLHYAVIARAPTFGAKLRRYDAAAAKAIPGVVAVVEVPQGVAVVAANTWAARRGRDALVTEWQDGAGARVSSSALAERYAALARKPGVVVASQGDVAAAQAAAARRLEADYAVPFLSHAAMEPLNCVAVPSQDGLDLHVGTQFQTADRDAAARVMGLPPERVRVHTTFLGGGFGRRANPFSDFIVDAVAVAKAVNRPVMTVWTREDDTRGGWYRPLAHARLTAGLGADGRPVAWSYTSVVQPVLIGTPFEAFVDPKTGIDGATHEGASHLAYAVPNTRCDVHQVTDVGVPVQWWRAVGHTYTAFAVEGFVDECAHAAGQDPVAYRLALLDGKPRHLAALKLAAEKAGWGRPLPQGRARGVAVHESFGSVVAEIAEVSLEDGRPRVHRVVAAIDCGTAVNPALVAHQVESAVTYGLSAALGEEITLENGRVQQSNFGDYPVLRLDAMPVVETHIVPSTAPPTGVGEPGTPPIAPAVANALFALTGVRVRRLPLKHATFA
jgi:isoquinoline 1-oxidoreductase beta subunit